MEDQRYKESYISSERPKPSSNDLTAGLDDSYSPSNDRKKPSDIDMWLSAYLNYEGSSDLPNISKLSNLDNITRSFSTWPSRAIGSFHASMPTQSSVWLNTSPILQHEELGWLSIVKADPQKDDDIIREYGTNPIFYQINFVNWPYLYTYQETPQDSQKREILERLAVIAQREDNWDGHGSPKPTDLTLAHAKLVMGTLLDSVISAGHRCDTPSISSDEDGNVTIAWYEDERQLHLQIGEHETEFFKVWGTNIDTEMDVDFLKPDNYLTLWEWLIDE